MSTKVKEPYFWKFLLKSPWQKLTLSQNLHQDFSPYTLFNLFHNSNNRYHFEACWTHYFSDDAKNFLKLVFWHSFYRSKFCEKTKIYRLKTDCNQRVLFFRLTTFAILCKGFLAREVRRSNTRSLKKSGFSKILANNSPAKKFCAQKNSATVFYASAKVAKQ